MVGQCPVTGGGLVPHRDVTGGPAPPDLHLRIVDLAERVREQLTQPRVAVLLEDRVVGSLQVGDPGLLFYYRNRLDGYGLLGSPTLHELLVPRKRPS